MSLSELMERFGTEAQCEAALEKARWPSGFVCPECGDHKHSVFLVNGHLVWQCARCRQQTTLCSGALFQASKLPLTKWFQTFYLQGPNRPFQPTLPSKEAAECRQLERVSNAFSWNAAVSRGPPAVKDLRLSP
jgi:hypothetical protein